MIDGVLACLYLGALWYAAPLLDFTDTSLATRFRNLAFFGIAIPLALAFVHLLYAPIVWIVVACLVFSRFRAAPPRTEYETGEAVTLAIAVVLAWPAMVRPLLDGDTLLYHLPIAASWVQSHSLWTSIAPYWYYPPGSESFAAGLFCVAGRFALPLAGIVPAMMLAARLYEYGRSRECSWWLSGMIALAFVSAPTVAVQIGTLQNDLWLAALFFEILVSVRNNGALTLTALMKPVGWLWEIMAAIVARPSLRTIALSLIPLAVWLTRDGILVWLHPVVPIAQAPPYFASTLAGHGVAGVIALIEGAAATRTLGVLVWIAPMVAVLRVPEARKYSFLGMAGLLLFALLPVSYSNGATNYAATGDSLRYALPALLCGLLCFFEIARMAQRAFIFVTALLVIGDLSWMYVTFSNDGYTLWAPLAALLCLASVCAMRRTRDLSAPVIGAALVIVAAYLAQMRAPDFYAADMRTPEGKPTGVFAYLAQQSWPSVVVVNMRPGLVIMATPQTETIPSGLEKMCARATERGALLVVGTNETDDVVAERAEARKCGTVRYDDGAALVVQP